MTETSSLNQYNKANDIIKIRKGKGLLLTYVIMSIKAENSRIAKNTLSLYIRTVIVMFVSLYTSRLVLQALGETDLGIYNLVGGIVSLMAFLQAAQTKSTSRFITYELGLGGEPSKLSRIYSICMTIHILLAIIIVVIAETVGLFIINEYTQIPESRMVAANLVYQFSILTFVMHFISGYVIFHGFGELWGGFFTENSVLYSFCYNGAYMLPELIFTLIGAVILLKTPQTRKFLLADFDEAND